MRRQILPHSAGCHQVSPFDLLYVSFVPLLQMILLGGLTVMAVTLFLNAESILLGIGQPAHVAKRTGMILGMLCWCVP